MSFTDPTYIEVFVKKQSGFQASLVSFLEGLQAGLLCSHIVFSLHLHSYDIDNILLNHNCLKNNIIKLTFKGEIVPGSVVTAGEINTIPLTKSGLSIKAIIAIAPPCSATTHFLLNSRV